MREECLQSDAEVNSFLKDVSFSLPVAVWVFSIAGNENLVAEMTTRPQAKHYTRSISRFSFCYEILNSGPLTEQMHKHWTFYTCRKVKHIVQYKHFCTGTWKSLKVYTLIFFGPSFLTVLYLHHDKMTNIWVLSTCLFLCPSACFMVLVVMGGREEVEKGGVTVHQLLN